MCSLCSNVKRVTILVDSTILPITRHFIMIIRQNYFLKPAGIRTWVTWCKEEYLSFLLDNGNYWTNKFFLIKIIRNENPCNVVNPTNFVKHLRLHYKFNEFNGSVHKLTLKRKTMFMYNYVVQGKCYFRSL